MSHLIDRAASYFGVMTPKRAATVAIVAAIMSVVASLLYATTPNAPVLTIGQLIRNMVMIDSTMMNVLAAISSVQFADRDVSDISFVQFADSAVILSLFLTVAITAVWAESLVYGLPEQRAFQALMFLALCAAATGHFAALHVRIGARARVAAIAATATVKKAE